MQRHVAATTLVLRSSESDVERRVAAQVAVDAVEARIVVHAEDVEQIAEVEPLGAHERLHLHARFAAELDLALRQAVEALALLGLDVLEPEDLLVAGALHRRVDLGDVAEREVRDGEAVDAAFARDLRVEHAGADRDLHVGVAHDGDAREGRDVGEVDVGDRHVDAQIVVEAEEHEATLDVRVREIAVGVLELHRVGSHGEVGSEMRFAEPDEALLGRVLHPLVVDGEVARRRREVPVELERVERAAEVRHVDVDDVPRDVRVLGDAERAHQLREVDRGDVG